VLAWLKAPAENCSAKQACERCPIFYEAAVELLRAALVEHLARHSFSGAEWRANARAIDGATLLVRRSPITTCRGLFTHRDLLGRMLKIPFIGRLFRSLELGAWLLRATWTRRGRPSSKASTLPT